MTPTQFIESFNKEHWNKMIQELHWADNVTLDSIKHHIINTVISVLQEQIEEMKLLENNVVPKGSSCYINGEIDDESAGGGYLECVKDSVIALEKTLSDWQALIN